MTFTFDDSDTSSQDQSSAGDRPVTYADPMMMEHQRRQYHRRRRHCVLCDNTNTHSQPRTEMIPICGPHRRHRNNEFHYGAYACFPCFEDHYLMSGCYALKYQAGNWPGKHDAREDPTTTCSPCLSSSSFLPTTKNNAAENAIINILVRDHREAVRKGTGKGRGYDYDKDGNCICPYCTSSFSGAASADLGNLIVDFVVLILLF